MSRTKGSKNISQDTKATPPITGADETLKLPEKPKDNAMLFTMEQVQAMVNAAVNKAMEAKTAIPAIDDDGYWIAKCQCQSDIFGCIQAEQVIILSEENEKALKLGKYAEIKKDKNGMDFIVTYAHLVKPSQYVLQNIMAMGEEKAIDTGVCIIPMRQSQSLDEKKPFNLVSAK